MTLLILDRDGVINQDSDAFIKSPDEWIPIPGSLEAIARLNRAGYRIAVASNQSGIARGYFDLQTLEAIHEKMALQLAALGGRIEVLLFCPHGPQDHCDCRKPLPGLFTQIGGIMRRDLHGVYAVGDSARDLQAAQSAGATPVLVKTGKGEGTLAQGGIAASVPVFDDLAAFTHSLLSGQLSP